MTTRRLRAALDDSHLPQRAADEHGRDERPPLPVRPPRPHPHTAGRPA